MRVVWSVAGRVRQSTATDMGSQVRRRSIEETSLRKLEDEISSATRCRETGHVGRREGFELEKVVSCGSGDQRWRAKLDLCGG